MHTECVPAETAGRYPIHKTIKDVDFDKDKIVFEENSEMVQVKQAFATRRAAICLALCLVIVAGVCGGVAHSMFGVAECPPEQSWNEALQKCEGCPITWQKPINGQCQDRCQKDLIWNMSARKCEECPVWQQKN